MNKPYVLASSLTFAIIVWLLLGVFSEDENRTKSTATSAAHPVMTVEVQPYRARNIQRRLTAYGNVQPNRAVTVRAETAGRIGSIAAEEGALVRAGQTLVAIQLDDRNARRDEARSLVNEKETSYNMVKKLGDQGYQAQRMVDESFSALQKARAELANIDLEIENTNVSAPFDGVLEKRFVEVGDYASINSEIATIVDNNPLTVMVHIPQQDINKIIRNSTTDVTFATGETRQGRVKFIATRAEESTRTFRVEISVDNPDGNIPSGISAEAHLPAGMITAQFVSPALFTLNDAGEIGIKSVTDNDTVAFFPVDIIYSEANGTWVSGLPEQTNVITVGQGFVRDGDTVIAKLASTEATTDTAKESLNTVQTQKTNDKEESIQ